MTDFLLFSSTILFITNLSKVALSIFLIIFFSSSNCFARFHQYELKASLWKPAEPHGLQRNIVVFLLINIDYTPAEVGPTDLCWSVQDLHSELEGTMHNYS